MRLRKRCLPPGWYPAEARQTRAAIEAMLASLGPAEPTGVAGVAPHAGWEFSGALALAVFSRIPRTIDTMVIIGGHLGPSDGILAAFEEGYETPMGVIEADLGLLEALRARVVVREDRSADNTVEIQLPFVRHLFPGVKALGLRAAPSQDVTALGEALAEVSRGAGRRIAVVGSTDLTHYGPSYGFLPKGTGDRGHEWVRDVNDRRFIESLLAMDAGEAAARSLRERSACSAGGAIAAMGFARALGCTRGTLVKYMTSREVHPGESFVGYAALVYEAPVTPNTGGGSARARVSPGRERP